MNPANFLTCSRAVLAGAVVFFIFSFNPFGRVVALFLFVVAALTDYWDGWIARELGQVSAFGKLMDPLADKALTLSAFLSFWRLGLLPFWMVAVIAVRDAAVTASRFWVPAEARGASSGGKHKTVLQILFIIAVLCYLVARELPQWKEAWNARALVFINSGMVFIVFVTVWTGTRVVFKNSSTPAGQKARQQPARFARCLRSHRRAASLELKFLTKRLVFRGRRRVNEPHRFFSCASARSRDAGDAEPVIGAEYLPCLAGHPRSRFGADGAVPPEGADRDPQ